MGNNALNPAPYEEKLVQGRRIHICQSFLVCSHMLLKLLGLRDVYEREEEAKGCPRESSGESNGKILTLFSFLVMFLGATQGHFHGVGEQSDREKRDNPYIWGYFKLQISNFYI